MTDDLRITAPSAEMVDAHLSPPPTGAHVLALGRGGVLTQTIWGRDSIKFFDAWSPFMKIPASVKARQGRPYAQDKEQG